MSAKVVVVCSRCRRWKEIGGEWTESPVTVEINDLGYICCPICRIYFIQQDHQARDRLHRPRAPTDAYPSLAPPAFVTVRAKMG